MSVRHILCRLLLPAFVGGLLLLAGCGEGERVPYASEIDEPSYREGQALLKAGRRQEALTAFLKVVDRRRDDAPESHLEAGLLYAQHINDPLSAIYHFRKYLAQRPNSPQAPLVRQRINAAIRDFARTLPAQPLENQNQRVDLIAAMDRLKQENELLKMQLAEAKTARGGTALGGGSAETPQTGTARVRVPEVNLPSFSLEPIPTVRTRPTPEPLPRVSPNAPVVPPPNVTGPSAGSRRHVVRPGDTLMKLAQQYYNNRTRWREIYAANRGAMKSEGDLKVGMELKIP